MFQLLCKQTNSAGCRGANDMRTREPAPQDGEYGVLEEIVGRVRAIQEAGNRVLPPLLLLGVMERVGSNWVSDTLRPVTGQHNEPFRQQVSHGHPLSALNPDPVRLKDAGTRLGPYGRHWLVTFAVSKYAPARQVIKETNLFFALPTLLALFPDSPVAVLSRSPLGVASSFARGDLFRRWDYRARYLQMVSITGRAGYRDWAPVVPDDDPPDLVALTRLQVLNTLLLANGLRGRDQAAGFTLIRYETAVLDSAAARASLARLVPEAPGFRAVDDEGSAATEDTFATNTGKIGLAACLDLPDAEAVRMATAEALAAGRHAVAAQVWGRAREWASGAHLYTLVSPTRPGSRPTVDCDDQPCPIRWVPGRSIGDLWWRNLLVSNDEFAAFLNEMAAAGLPNCLDGNYLLACEMPHERGGRLHRAALTGRWTVSPGFASHPAYWVTWTGAAAFAARHGARLPARSEMIAETRRDDVTVTNSGYQVGDTVSVAQPGRSPWEIHHPVGNLQVWCGDGPAARRPIPVTRWLHGAAWNTPGTPEEIHRPRDRHLSGASRGVGIRLVRERAGPAATAARICDVLRGWIQLLADRSQPLEILDQALAEGLAALSQPDGGLGTHIGASVREPRHGQFDEPVSEAQGGKVAELHELHAADRRCIRPGRDISHRAASPPGLESQVNDMGPVPRQVVADVQQPARLDIQAGLLPHFPHQRGSQGLAVLHLAARQAPRPARISVLVQQQDAVVLDDNPGHAHTHRANLPDPKPAITGSPPALVVVAAGGLGTRVYHWARFIPKEFYPVDGRPGITHLLDEIQALGPARIAVVYHPYYEQFAAWARQVLSHHDHARYADAARHDVTAAIPPELTLSLIPQHGPYADLTSVLNGADYLAVQDGVYVAFADNLYRGPSPLPLLRDTAPGHVAVLASRYDADLAASRGILITSPCPSQPRACRVSALIEKPGPAKARELEERHGPGNLLMLEGRARLTASFIEFASARRWSSHPPDSEPKLALAIGAYAREHPVLAVPTDCGIIDLGSPDIPSRARGPKAAPPYTYGDAQGGTAS
jgi:UTP-glucose-1-phosphate uridylyltransferase